MEPNELVHNVESLSGDGLQWYQSWMPAGKPATHEANELHARLEEKGSEMFVSSTACEVPEGSGFSHCLGEHFELYWKGHAYLPGMRQGYESMVAFERLIHEQGTVAAARRLKGVYVCLVRDRTGETLDIFVDPSGLRAIYRTPAQVATSFLEIAASGAQNYGAISLRSVIELIELGGTYFGRTLATRVRSLGRDEIVRFRAGHSGYEIIKKDDMALTEPARMGRHDYFENLAKALQGSRVNVDLTGGVDSRYTAVMLKHFGCDFSVGIASRPDHPDAIISAQVAEQLGVKHRVVDHRWHDLDRELRDTFFALDGVANPVALFRAIAYVKSLAEEGVDIDVQSIGETYKDWIWYQDFPFYGSRKTNLQRLFDYRLYSTKMPEKNWHPSVRELLRSWPRQFVADMEVFRYPRNTTSYDAVIAFGKGQASISKSVSGRARFVNMSVPFFDLDLVRESIHMNPWSRVFDQVYRHDLSRVNPNVAKIPTAEGLTVSDAASDMLLDALRLTRFYGKRALKVMGRKLLRKTFFQVNADALEFQQEVLQLPLLDACVERLKRLRILDQQVSPAFLRAKVGPLITLGLLFELTGDAAPIVAE